MDLALFDKTLKYDHILLHWINLIYPVFVASPQYNNNIPISNVGLVDH